MSWCREWLIALWQAELARAAKDLLASTTDPKVKIAARAFVIRGAHVVGRPQLKGSKFMEFVQQLGEGELRLDGNKVGRGGPCVWRSNQSHPPPLP